MTVKRGDSKKIIVGAAQVFVSDSAVDYYVEDEIDPGKPAASGLYFADTVSGTARGIPAFKSGESFADTLEDDTNGDFINVGYTTNGLELSFEPDFGEVKVDQLLDVAKLYKQGMKVTLKTTFAEATLENLLIAVAGSADDLNGSDEKVFDLSAGDLGECPVERAIVAIGPGTGDCAASGAEAVERVYVAYRVLSIDNVTVSAKRDEASTFEVTFRLLPASNGKYGKIVDRVIGAAAS